MLCDAEIRAPGGVKGCLVVVPSGDMGQVVIRDGIIEMLSNPMLTRRQRPSRPLWAHSRAGI